ncbi:MAG: hypothetical protein ACE5HE_14930 [Phycisphaerae bacterium]
MPNRRHLAYVELARTPSSSARVCAASGGRVLSRRAEAVALATSAMGSGYLMGAAVTSHAHAPLGWFCLLPIYFAIRTCAPGWAGACGAVWGACLYVALLHGVDMAPAAVPAFVLLTLVPAVYAFLGALATSWFGYSPFVLAVGWMGVELASAPVGLHHGLLAGTPADGTLMTWVGQGLGYVFVAFIVAAVNASVVSALSAVRLRLGDERHSPTRTDRGASHMPKEPLVFISSLAVSPSQPRAPPLCGAR